MKVLVVEDDSLLNHTICYNLSLSGYIVDAAMTKTSAMRFFREQIYDMIILDINLPDGSGFDICREIKGNQMDIAVIFLTANDLESDMLKGFELGADDYVTKPFPISVFKKKIEALAKHIQKRNENDCYSDGRLFLDFVTNTANFDGTSIMFTSMEYRLLKMFTQNSNIVLTRKMLLERLWDSDENFVDEHALTAMVSRVRNKLDFVNLQYIKTVYGMGYMWIGGINIEYTENDC